MTWLKPKLRIATGVTVILKAEHRSQFGNVHPHEWEITMFAPEVWDAMVARCELNEFLQPLQGTCLPDRLARGEQLAAAVLHHFREQGCYRVEVRRHAEGIYAEASYG